jgi:hypothetical protein
MSLSSIAVSAAVNFLVAGVVWYLRGPLGGVICFGIGSVLIIAVYLRPHTPNTPNIHPVRYGYGQERLVGLGVVNTGAPAYELMARRYTPLGERTLLVLGGIQTLRKGDSEVFFIVMVDRTRDKPGCLGDRLNDAMRQNKVNGVTFPLIYGDAEGQWYRTDIKLERDSSPPFGIRFSSTKQTSIATPRLPDGWSPQGF